MALQGFVIGKNECHLTKVPHVSDHRHQHPQDVFHRPELNYVETTKSHV
jgi:hypothetical protein